jgi:hypothetical protein
MQIMLSKFVSEILIVTVKIFTVFLLLKLC